MYNIEKKVKIIFHVLLLNLFFLVNTTLGNVQIDTTIEISSEQNIVFSKQDTIHIVSFPFRNAKYIQDSTLNWLESDIPRMLNTELTSFPKDLIFNVLYREDLALLRSEEQLYLNDPQSWIKKLKEEERGSVADYFLLGSFRKHEDDLRIDAILIEGTSTKIIIGKSQKFKYQDLLDNIPILGRLLHSEIYRAFDLSGKRKLAIIPFECDDEEWRIDLHSALRTRLNLLLNKIDDVDLQILPDEPYYQDIIESYYAEDILSSELGTYLGADYCLFGKISITQEERIYENNYLISYDVRSSASSTAESLPGPDIIGNYSNYNKKVEEIALNVLEIMGYKDVIPDSIINIYSIEAQNYDIYQDYTPMQILSEGISLYENGNIIEAESILTEASNYNESKEIALFYLGEIEGQRKNIWEQLKIQYSAVKENRWVIGFEIKTASTIFKTFALSSMRGNISILNEHIGLILPKFYLGYKMTPNSQLNFSYGFYHKMLSRGKDPIEYSDSGEIFKYDVKENTSEFSDLLYNYTISHKNLQMLDFYITWFFLPELEERELIPFLRCGFRYIYLTPSLSGVAKFNDDIDFISFRGENNGHVQNTTKFFAGLGIEYYISQKRPSIFGNLSFYFYGEIIKAQNFEIQTEGFDKLQSIIELSQITFTLGIKSSEPLFVFNVISRLF